MDNERLFRLHWTAFDKTTGEARCSGSGVYLGRNLAEAQEDAFNTLVEDSVFDPETIDLVFAKNYQEAEIG